jgi:uncharacterized protein
MLPQQYIEQTAAYVRQTLQQAEGGHDWWHILRVWNNAKLIAQTEPADIADSKFYNGDEEIGPKTAVNFLRTLDVNPTVIEHVENIIRHMSFKSSLGGNTFFSPEMAIVQDADRLDAIGAIGIARAFNYGGYKGREMHNPEVASNLQMSKDEYKKTTAPTINHFYEKLLLLKDKMNTATARKLAEDRHQYMQGFLDQFYGEWEGNR